MLLFISSLLLCLMEPADSVGGSFHRNHFFREKNPVLENPSVSVKQDPAEEEDDLWKYLVVGGATGLVVTAIIFATYFIIQACRPEPSSLVSLVSEPSDEFKQESNSLGRKIRRKEKPTNAIEKASREAFTAANNWATVRTRNTNKLNDDMEEIFKPAGAAEPQKREKKEEKSKSKPTEESIIDTCFQFSIREEDEIKTMARAQLQKFTKALKE